jgi:hypothetical protein
MDVNRTPSDSLKDEILTSYRCVIAVFKRFAYQLVYISEAETPIEPNQFEDLLVVSRARNQIKHLTAMLVACDLQFLQVLEGNPADVIATFDRIALDPRHENLVVLHRGYSSVGRTFAASSMGFHSVAVDDQAAKEIVHKNDGVDFYQFDGLTALEFLLRCRPPAAAA